MNYKNLLLTVTPNFLLAAAAQKLSRQQAKLACE